MEFQKAVAKNIKQMREQKKLTLDAAAKLTGVSRSMLAQIEKGDANPTISILWKIANGYKVSFTSLLNHSQRTLLVKGEEAPPLYEDEGRYMIRPAFPFQEDRQFETYRVEIQADGFLQAQPHLDGAEEYITVFSGTMEIVVGEERFSLREGDSLRFQANVAHSYRNIGTEPVRLNMMIYYA